MSDRFECIDAERLVAWLYDDGDQEERARTAAHLASCATCHAEMTSLSATRRALAEWVPPEVSVGWRLPADSPAQASESAAGPSARAPRGWWHRPLPAWAQAAAAVLIFAAGMLAGAGRQQPAAVPAAAAGDWLPTFAALEGRLERVETSARAYEAHLSAGAAPDWRPTLAAFEDRLERIESSAQADGAAVSAAAMPADLSDSLMRQVRTEIAASEARMRGELALGLVQLKREENHLQQLLMADVDARLNSHIRHVSQRLRE